jgi:membrane-associated protease RseP (regulator of RpoE activity)
VDWLVVVGILLFFVGLMLSIALHEIGHLVPAKLFGIRVTQYMVGFGRTIWSRRRGDTEYGVKAVPLGGFIRMIGMFPPEPGGDPRRLRKASTGPIQALVEDARRAASEEIQPGDEDRVFYRKAWWKKLIVMLGGPAMNVILALLLAAGVLMTFGNPERPVLAPTVSQVSECVIPASEERATCEPTDVPAPAAEAGFQPLPACQIAVDIVGDGCGGEQDARRPGGPVLAHEAANGNWKRFAGSLTAALR